MTHSSGSLGPSIWAVSDGRAGNAAQVRAIISALTETRRWMQIAHIQGSGHRADPLTLQPRAPWTWLPSINWPAPRLALPPQQRAELNGPWPSLWIAAGRRSAPYTVATRGWSGGQTYTVQLLDPKSDPAAFDMVVVPEHDDLRGPNVVRTIGSPSHFSEDAVEEAGQAFADLADERRKSVIVILGGNSKSHTFTRKAAEDLEQQIETLAAQGWRVRITTSRRTPISVIVSMRAMADRVGAEFWSGSEDGQNPYLGWLLYSDAAIVTEDSANMLCDAAWHGLPVHIARLSGKSAKFSQFHEDLIGRGCARWFTGTLDQWDYDPLREAGRVADKIIENLLERYPQPEITSGQDTTPMPDWD